MIQPFDVFNESMAGGRPDSRAQRKGKNGVSPPRAEKLRNPSKSSQ